MSNWQGFRYPAVTGNDIAHGLYLTSLGRIVYPSGASYPGPGHPPEYHFLWNTGRILGDFAFVWIEQGCGQVETAALGRAALAAGDILLLPPGAWHRYRPDPKTGWVERWVCANGTCLHKLRIHGTFPSSAEIRPARNAKALGAAFDQLRAQSDGNSLWVSGLTLTILALALGETEKSADRIPGQAVSGDASVDAAVRYIWMNCHRTLGVSDIAKHAGISRRMLERRFAQAWPRSVAREITLARVQRGRDLLAEESLTVKEAGYAAGFGGARRFISAHRRIFGTTPAAARRQN